MKLDFDHKKLTSQKWCLEVSGTSPKVFRGKKNDNQLGNERKHTFFWMHINMSKKSNAAQNLEFPMCNVIFTLL